VFATPYVAPASHLALESCPKTLHRLFNHVIKCVYMLEMPHMHVLWRLQVRLKKSCKMGDSVSVEQFNVWHIQQVDYGQFITTKLSVYHIDTNEELGLFWKITCFPPDPLLTGVLHPSQKGSIQIREHRPSRGFARVRRRDEERVVGRYAGVAVGCFGGFYCWVLGGSYDPSVAESKILIFGWQRGEEADVDHRDAWWISFLEDPT
jgi:hypothetical protein